MQEFYEGKATVFTPAGWNEQCNTLLAKLESPDVGVSVRALADSLGKRIAAEWAKDKRASKLDAINDLSKWDAEMKAAAEQDDGSGAKITETLTTIDREVTAMLGNK
ncbi:MAG: hypothetical protein CMJ64_04290 [Planctomycetaceae bacterium]|nr:hypothetical protein [Planctomycetaceae bacterium]